IAVYIQVRDFSFISFDDDIYVYNCPQVQEGFTLQNFIWCFKSIHANNWHPLTSTSSCGICSMGIRTQRCFVYYVLDVYSAELLVVHKITESKKIFACTVIYGPWSSCQANDCNITIC